MRLGRRPKGTPVNFTLPGILASFVVSSVGYVSFHYGKKSARMPQLVGGLALMIFPAFVSSVWLMLAVGAAIVGLQWLAVRAGL